MLPERVVFIAALINLIGALLYVRETLKGDAQPNRVTWLLWGVAPLIATCGQISAGVGLSTVAVFMTGFGPLLVFISSFLSRRGYWRLSALDYCCGALSATGLALWAYVGDPRLAILFAILADAFAAIPTVIKAWTHPQTENLKTYILAFAASLIGIATVQNYSFASFAFISYIAAINGIIVISLIIAERRRKSMVPSVQDKVGPAPDTFSTPSAAFLASATLTAISGVSTRWQSKLLEAERRYLTYQSNLRTGGTHLLEEAMLVLDIIDTKTTSLLQYISVSLAVAIFLWGVVLDPKLFVTSANMRFIISISILCEVLLLLVAILICLSCLNIVGAHTVKTLEIDTYEELIIKVTNSRRNRYRVAHKISIATAAIALVIFVALSCVASARFLETL